MLDLFKHYPLISFLLITGCLLVASFLVTTMIILGRGHSNIDDDLHNYW